YGGDFGERHNDGNFCMDGLCYPDRRPHTGLLEVKQVYRPVRVTKGEKEGSFVLQSFLAFADAGDLLDGSYEITCDGKVIDQGTFEFQIEPLGKTQIEIGLSKAKSAQGRTDIRFRFTAKKDQIWCERGYEICFDQIQLSEGVASAKKATDNAGSIAVEENGFCIRINAGDFAYQLDKRIGSFSSIQVKGREILDRPMQFNFFRAPVDNDTMRGEWYRAHLNDYDVKIYDTEVTEEKGSVKITVHQSFGWNMYQPFCKATTVYVIDGNGKLQIVCDGETSNKVTLLPRFGIRLFLNRCFDEFSYLGYGPGESYVDKHQGSYYGAFASKVEDAFEDYIRPQENSSHYGCSTMTITGGETKVTFTAPQDFSFNVSEYTQEELAGKRHNFELEKCGSTVVCVDAMMAGVGSNSCGPALAQIYRIELPKIHLDLSMEIR
ncbi:MAG: DUF4981 domain-containing protein, partial [Lachnospiraceae bacterium]|nr:DUF4981 domain-containing protein [Lachnospiraceae bacterium]